MSTKKLLVADTAFIPDDLIQKFQLVSVFPMKKGDGAYRANLDELLERSKIQARFFNETLPELNQVLAKFMPSAGNEAHRLTRMSLVKTTSIFVDRTLRVLERLKLNPQTFDFVSVENRSFQWISDIDQSWRINQDAIQRIMRALGHEGVRVLEPQNYPEFPKEHVQKNLLFRPEGSGLAAIKNKILGKTFSYLNDVSNKKSDFQSLGFGADRFYLAKRGLLGPFGYFHANLKSNLLTHELQPELRENILKSVSPILTRAFTRLAQELTMQMNEDDLNRLSKMFAQTFVDWFPISFLEGLEGNLKHIEKQLDFNQFKYVIGHDVTSNLGIFISTLARLKGKEVIGIQHGGHYGYIEDLSIVGHMEYAFYDKMITWGWNKIDTHLPHCETLPLPIPKLSEHPIKSDYFSKIGQSEQRDVLFYSNLFHRFPHTSTCGQARVDFIDQITESQKNLIQALSRSKITVDHKPYSMKFVDLYPQHFRELESVGGEPYRLLKSVHKGLTPEFIKTCRLILWDQVGSGTLECFTSGVPTMVFWEKIYSRESVYSRDLIEQMRRCGVIHSDPVQLAKEIQIYLANPRGWMENTERKTAIENFCRVFALSDPQWHKIWKKQLRNWGK